MFLVFKWVEALGGDSVKRIIDGVIYNDETAEEIASDWNGTDSMDFHYFEENLMMTKKGNLFISGNGGPMTKYAESCGSNQTTGSSRIKPLTPEEAIKWCEQANVGEEDIEKLTKMLKKHHKIEVKEA